MTTGTTISVDTTELDRLVTRLHELGGQITTQALKRAVQRISDRIAELLLKPTQQWNHKPRAVVKVTASRRVAMEIRVQRGAVVRFA